MVDTRYSIQKVAYLEQANQSVFFLWFNEQGGTWRWPRDARSTPFRHQLVHAFALQDMPRKASPGPQTNLGRKEPLVITFPAIVRHARAHKRERGLVRDATSTTRATNVNATRGGEVWEPHDRRARKFVVRDWPDRPWYFLEGTGALEVCPGAGPCYDAPSPGADTGSVEE